MFHKTSTKLAALYLAIIMTISLFFSVVVYQQSVQELDRGIRRPEPGLDHRVEQGIGPLLRAQLQQEREELYQIAKSRILMRLVLINLVIAVSGGFLSYYLARRTLIPIEESHEALERFTADASHELRTPLAAMRSEIEVALMNSKLTLDTAKEVLVSNLEEVERLTRLSEGLLQLAHLQNESLELRDMSVRSMIHSVVDQVSPQATSKQILVETEVEKGVHARGERQLLTEAVTILVDNAIKYSPDKSVITITASRRGHGAQITVTDNGVGIAADDLPRLFERFYRANSARSKQKIGGYGLGLAIAKNIVDLHGGQLTVTSQQGLGSVFTILLP